jgi:hypothetical protein
MLEKLLELLPDRITQMSPALAMGLAAAGLLLGIVGARLSRSILALALVAAGTIIGLNMPHWFGWKIDPMGTAFGGAILLGLSGFLLSILWEAIVFGALLALAAAVAVWLSLAPGAAWKWPDIDWSATAVEIGIRIWQSVPVSVGRALPIGSGLGFAIGVSLMAAWPRLGRALLYSVLGMLILVLSGTIGIRQTHPDWMEKLTWNSWTQGAVFAGMVLITSIVQWLFMPRPAPRTAATPSENKPQKVEPAAFEEPAPPTGGVTPPPPPKWAFPSRTTGETRPSPTQSQKIRRF